MAIEIVSYLASTLIKDFNVTSILNKILAE